MKWLIRGALSSDGIETEFECDEPTRAAAERWAETRGICWSSIEPAGPTPTPEAHWASPFPGSVPPPHRPPRFEAQCVVADAPTTPNYPMPAPGQRTSATAPAASSSTTLREIVAALLVVGGAILCFSALDLSFYAPARFSADNAWGATANAAKRVAEGLDLLYAGLRGVCGLLMLILARLLWR